MIRDPAAAAIVHFVFEWTGVAVGAALYRRACRHTTGREWSAPGQFAVIVGLLVGAGLGNKLAFLAERPEVFMAWLDGQWIAPGQSIVGGLLGGLLGVELAKKLTGQSRSTGDAMVLPIAAGLAIGRIGCLLAGVHDDTYGVVTTLPWGMDLGDGLRRHPTALYEIGFVLAWATWLHRHRLRWQAQPGTLFKLFLAGYLAWRLAVDLLKPVPHDWGLGLSGIQWVCLIALALYGPVVLRALRLARASAPQAGLSSTREA